MPKFKEGDVVRVIKGWNEGEEGTVTNPYFQIAANDWPFVLFTDNNGTRHSADESDLLLIEDPTYEYAIQRARRLSGLETSIVGEFWGTRSEVNISLLNLNTENFSYKLVKRKKAGPIEDA